jgi:hypothetical protein
MGPPIQSITWNILLSAGNLGTYLRGDLTAGKYHIFLIFAAPLVVDDSKSQIGADRKGRACTKRRLREAKYGLATQSKIGGGWCGYSPQSEVAAG